MGSRLLKNWLNIPSTCSYTPANSRLFRHPDKLTAMASVKLLSPELQSVCGDISDKPKSV
jgi:hypothetical protein